jgi:Rrf2 family protein
MAAHSATKLRPRQPNRGRIFCRLHQAEPAAKASVSTNVRPTLVCPGFHTDERIRSMLTAKGKYGLKALAHLAALQPGETVQAIDIATVNNIPKKFLDAILGDLRNAGIVASKKGPGGGYLLTRMPGDITLGQVIRTLDGPLAPIACASRTAYRPCRDCIDVKLCAVRLAMSQVRDAMSDVLDQMTVADLLALGGQSEKALSREVRTKARSAVKRPKSTKVAARYRTVSPVSVVASKPLPSRRARGAAKRPSPVG